MAETQCTRTRHLVEPHSGRSLPLRNGSWSARTNVVDMPGSRLTLMRYREVRKRPDDLKPLCEEIALQTAGYLRMGPEQTAALATALYPRLGRVWQ